MRWVLKTFKIKKFSAQLSRVDRTDGKLLISPVFNETFEFRASRFRGTCDTEWADG